VLSKPQSPKSDQRRRQTWKNKKPVTFVFYQRGRSPSTIIWEEIFSPQSFYTFMKNTLEPSFAPVFAAPRFFHNAKA
jgi:hypothetical protein